MKFKLTILIGVMAFSVSAASAARVLLRIDTRSADTLNQYKAGGYPECKAGMDYMSMDDPSAANRRLFNTSNALIEIGFYKHMVDQNLPYSHFVVTRIREYESNGWNVYGVFLYDETWLAGLPGGPYSEDSRIISGATLKSIRDAIRDAKPALKSKDTVRLIQMLGGDKGKNVLFKDMNNALKTHLLKFEGLGTECHVGDEVDRPAILADMAVISKWTKDNSKIALNFMGGTAASYVSLPKTMDTYNALWSRMDNQGVSKKAAHMIYFRQGARDGNHTPETSGRTLTHQMRWLIQTVK